MSSARSLAHGNRLQRAYHRWALPYYERMTPDQREQAELIDSFLYSGRGLLGWAGLLAAVVGSALGLMRTGLPPWLCWLASLMLWVGVPMMALTAWLTPTGFTGARMRRAFPRLLAIAVVAAIAGFTVGQHARTGSLDPQRVIEGLWRGLPYLAITVLAISVAMLLLLGGVAQVRRQILERRLLQLELDRERDQARQAAVQAQLKLLQLQIQPHFIFNTLSAVQHWVDLGDPRAGALLRSLTAFLRGSTEALARESVTLGEETALVRHYLEVMQARLGERLRWSIEVPQVLAAQPLPPGLLLTLVENAIEHGISASLSGGEVRLVASRDDTAAVITLSDSAGLWHPEAPEGVGLSNCRARLQHRFGDTASLVLAVEDGRTVATLRLPGQGTTGSTASRAAP